MVLDMTLPTMLPLLSIQIIIYHLSFKKSLYSLPTKYIGKHVDVRGDSALVKIYFKGLVNKDPSKNGLKVKDQQIILIIRQRLPRIPCEMQIIR